MPVRGSPQRRPAQGAQPAARAPSLQASTRRPAPARPPTAGRRPPARRRVGSRRGAATPGSRPPAGRGPGPDRAPRDCARGRPSATTRARRAPAPPRVRAGASRLPPPPPPLPWGMSAPRSMPARPSRPASGAAAGPLPAGAPTTLDPGPRRPPPRWPPGTVGSCAAPRSWLARRSVRRTRPGTAGCRGRRRRGSRRSPGRGRRRPQPGHHRPPEPAQQRDLRRVGVLVLIDHDQPERLAQLPPRSGVVGQHGRPQDQLGVVEAALELQGREVLLEEAAERGPHRARPPGGRSG